MDDVRDDYLETAKKLLFENKGDAIAALSKALATNSG